MLPDIMLLVSTVVLLVCFLEVVEHGVSVFIIVTYVLHHGVHLDTMFIISRTRESTTFLHLSRFCTSKQFMNSDNLDSQLCKN